MLHVNGESQQIHSSCKPRLEKRPVKQLACWLLASHPVHHIIHELAFLFISSAGLVNRSPRK